MHAPTSLTLLLFFLSLGCTAVPLIFPGETVGLVLLAVGIVGSVSSVAWWLFSNYRLVSPLARRSQIAGAHAEPSAQVERWPLIEIFRKVEKEIQGNVSVITFSDQLRQAGLDGTLQFWGRPARFTDDSLVRREPLNEIPREHWKDFQIEWFYAFKFDNQGNSIGIEADNFPLRTKSFLVTQSQNTYYKDIHVSKKAAMGWLEGREF